MKLSLLLKLEWVEASYWRRFWLTAGCFFLYLRLAAEVSISDQEDQDWDITGDEADITGDEKVLKVEDPPQGIAPTDTWCDVGYLCFGLLLYFL